MSLTELRTVGAGRLQTIMAKRVVNLYRRMCREVVPIRTMYQIDETPAEIRHMVLLQFRKSSTATDPRIIDMLITRGEMELEEARKQWKQRGHLMSLIKPEMTVSDPLLQDLEGLSEAFANGSLDERALWRGHSAPERAKIMARVLDMENQQAKAAFLS